MPWASSTVMWARISPTQASWALAMAANWRAPLDGQAHEGGAPILLVGASHHQALGHQAIDNARDVAVRDHQEARKLRHGQARGLALERRHHIELRQGRAEGEAQALAQLRFHGTRGLEQPQPEAQLLPADRLGPRGELRGGTRSSLGRHLSPPETAAWPLTCPLLSIGHHTRSAAVSERAARRCSWSRPDRYGLGQVSPA